MKGLEALEGSVEDALLAHPDDDGVPFICRESVGIIF